MHLQLSRVIISIIIYNHRRRLIRLNCKCRNHAYFVDGMKSIITTLICSHAASYMKLSLLYIVWYEMKATLSIRQTQHPCGGDKTMPNLKLPQSVSIKTANMTSVKVTKLILGKLRRLARARLPCTTLICTN